MKENQKYMSSQKEIQLMKYPEQIFQSDQVFRGVNTCKKNTMNNDDLNVGDGRGREEDLKKREKEEVKDGSKEEEASLKMKRKPPKEMMKGGIRDRSLVSWIRILGWFFLFQVCIDSSLLLFSHHAQWWLPSGGRSSLASWQAASPSCEFLFL